MRELAKRYAPALCASIVAGFLALAMAPTSAEAGCRVELTINNNSNKQMGFYEVYVKFKKGGGHWVGMRGGFHKKILEKGKSKTLKKGWTGFTSPKCKRKKKVKIRYFKKNVNKVKTHVTKNWVGGKKLKLGWNGSKFTFSAK